MISQTEYFQFIENLKEQTTQFITTGQYKQVLRIKKLLQLNVEKNRFADITSETLQYYSTPEFFKAFIDSLRIMGRQSRDEAWQLCEDYGELLIPFLMNALINEETQSFRSLLMSLIRQFGDVIVPEALRLLDDSRWFIKRNMLYLLNGCKNEKIIPSVRPYCRHENPKVRFEAIKCLLCLNDDYGLERIREYLHTGTKADIEQAITLLSAYRIKEAVPDLIQMLKEKDKNKSYLSQKIAIIQALGNMGDLRSLDAFREILFRKTFFLFKGGIDNLKVEIYRTLKNYPYKDIEDIIQMGLTSRNEYIKNESLRLMKTRKQ
jgi:HEAT repeat protein